MIFWIILFPMRATCTIEASIKIVAYSIAFIWNKALINICSNKMVVRVGGATSKACMHLLSFQKKSNTMCDHVEPLVSSCLTLYLSTTIVIGSINSICKQNQSSFIMQLVNSQQPYKSISKLLAFTQNIV